MAFIDKKDPIVLNIKLTSKGRELLSKGQLNFRYYAIGDSEIDYEFNRNAGFNPFNANILRPKDKNPKQLSFILRDVDGSRFNEISNVPSTPSPVINRVQPIGFFNDDVTEFLTDTDRVRQPDIAIEVSGVTGGTELELKQAPNYQANQNEPMVGDFLLVKWTNPLGNDTTGYTINKSFPTPYLWYRIDTIVSGSLGSNNLRVRVDRELPNFSGITGGSNSILAGAMAYYNSANFTGDTTYSTDYADQALLAFLQNCQCPTVTFPFWNMSIIFTEEIVGVNVNSGETSYTDYKSRAFAGFVSYIQNQQKYNEDFEYKRKLGVIHYTNNTVSNTYGEGFYGDPLDPVDKEYIPTLDIPTVMWHKSTGATLGLQLKAAGRLKYLTGATKSLNTRYYDLVPSDIGPNYRPEDVVGKVFYDLKVFVIEDQELLFAMSYKSNRSWTLPEHKVDINANITFGCPTCLLDYNVEVTSPTTVGGSDGTITVSGITNSSLDDSTTSLILEILEGPTGTTNPTKVFFNEITGDTTITNNDTLNNFKLSAGTYTVRLIDTGFINCIVPEEITIPTVTSTLNIIGNSVDTTSSRLNQYFTVSPQNNNPTYIKFTEGLVGNPATPYITIVPTGTSIDNSYLNGLPEVFTDNDTLGGWKLIPSGGSVNVTNLIFKEAYQIFVRDSVYGDFSGILESSAITSQVWTYYVAAANPFVGPNDINVTRGSDSGGEYVVISNYIDPSLDPNINPIVGDIEISLHKTTELPFEWNSTPNDGTSVKLYLNNMSSGTYSVSIRERYDYIKMYVVVASDTFTIT